MSVKKTLKVFDNCPTSLVLHGKTISEYLLSFHLGGNKILLNNKKRIAFKYNKLFKAIHRRKRKNCYYFNSFLFKFYNVKPEQNIILFSKILIHNIPKKQNTNHEHQIEFQINSNQLLL